MNDPGFPVATVDSPSPASAPGEVSMTMRCPKCGRQVKSLRCGHCGSQLALWQADLYAAAIRQIAKTGGNRADTGHEGGVRTDATGRHGDDDQPRDGGVAADDCFATPSWLLAALRRDYGDFGLDAAASHGHAVAERYYAAEDDALGRDWAADCGGKPVFVNPPFRFGALERFVTKAFEESRRGAVVVCILPFYKSYRWFRDYVWRHAEVRMI